LGEIPSDRARRPPVASGPFPYVRAQNPAIAGLSPVARRWNLHRRPVVATRRRPCGADGLVLDGVPRRAEGVPSMRYCSLAVAGSLTLFVALSALAAFPFRAHATRCRSP